MGNTPRIPKSSAWNDFFCHKRFSPNCLWQYSFWPGKSLFLEFPFETTTRHIRPEDVIQSLAQFMPFRVLAYLEQSHSCHFDRREKSLRSLRPDGRSRRQRGRGERPFDMVVGPGGRSRRQHENTLVQRFPKNYTLCNVFGAVALMTRRRKTTNPAFQLPATAII